MKKRIAIALGVGLLCFAIVSWHGVFPALPWRYPIAFGVMGFVVAFMRNSPKHD